MKCSIFLLRGEILAPLFIKEITMEELKTLETYDLPDTYSEYRYAEGQVTVPQMTQRNFEILIERHNEMVDFIVKMARHCGFTGEVCDD